METLCSLLAWMFGQHIQNYFIGQEFFFLKLMHMSLFLKLKCPCVFSKSFLKTDTPADKLDTGIFIFMKIWKHSKKTSS